MKCDKQKKYDTILWDVDGTLLDFLASERYAITKTFETFGFDIDEEIIQTYSRINESYWKRLEKGEITKLEVLRGRFETLFLSFAPGGTLQHKTIDRKRLQKISVEDFRLVYQDNLGKVYCYQDDSLEVCKKLQTQGFHQFVITNGVVQTQKSRLKMAGFYDVMDDIFISEEIGFDKPDARFFEGCFQKMHAKGFEIDCDKMLIIGDSQSSDMQGARNMKIDACLYVGKRDNREKSLKELAALNKVSYVLADLRKVDEIVWQEAQIKN